MTEQSIRVKGYEGPAGPTRERPVISSLRIEKTPAHWHIGVWNRGGKAGTLCVDADDGPEVIRRLFGSDETEEWREEAFFRCQDCGNRDSLPADPPPSHYQSCSAGCGGKMIPVITVQDAP